MIRGKYAVAQKTDTKTGIAKSAESRHAASVGAGCPATFEALGSRTENRTPIFSECVFSMVEGVVFCPDLFEQRRVCFFHESAYERGASGYRGR